LSERTGGETAPPRYILGAVKIVGENAKDTGDILQRFFDWQATQLPDAPRSCLRKFVQETRFAFGQPNHLAGMTALIAAFASFRSEFEYLIADTEAVTKSLVARALTHLQGSIVADEVVRKRWRKAFKGGETACERLGACQLLLHGIWSFKASAEGARTDLVLGETTWDEARRVAQGLVLTEWKLVRRESERVAKAREGYEQAKLYCAGPLAGFELTSTRYIVLVSRERLETPPPELVEDVTYEFRNVAVAPKSPSLEARKVARSKRRETA